MARVSFKAKVQETYNGDKFIKVPVIERSHCDMSAFRIHPKIGGYANSDMFPSIINRAVHSIFGSTAGKLMINSIPNNVMVDTSGFLAVVTIDL